MIDKLEELNKKYLEVEGELSKPDTVSDMKLFKKLLFRFIFGKR